MQVLVPFKGVQQGDIVAVMMLSIKKSEEASLMVSPPEVLEPDPGDVFFLCLGPTLMTNSFAAITAPYNEDLSVFPLHRSRETSGFSSRDDGKRLLLNDQRFEPIRWLVNEAGEILPDGAAKLRVTYKAEIKKAPKNVTIYLEWQACTNAYGWISDVPKGFCPTNSTVKK
jgi:hypothetical protein